MARSQSAIMSVEDRKSIRASKKALAGQLKDAKADLRAADRESKACAKAVAKIEKEIEKLDGRLTKDKERRQAA